MKFLNKSLLILATSLSFFYANAQGTNLLKEFINKNGTAIRSVHKYSIKNPDPKTTELVTELVKWQVIAAKYFNSDKAVSTAAAMKVRTQSLEYLSKNASGSIDYLKLTDEESQKFGSASTSETPKKYLSDKEIKSINHIDQSKATFFNDFTLSIQ